MYLLLGAAFGLVLLMPVLVIYFFTAGIKRRTAAHMLGCVFFLFYLCAVFNVTGLPSIRYITLDVNVNLVPFADIGSNSLQYILNTILFIPYGLLLPLLWERFRKAHKTILSAALFSLFIEISQLFCYRATDVDDMITNTAGGAIGYLLLYMCAKVFPKLTKSFSYRYEAGHPRICGRESVFLTVMAVLVMMTMQPIVMDAIWHVRIR